MTDPAALKPEKPEKAEKAEKSVDPAEKARLKMEAEQGLLGPADRYKALVNGVKAAQDLLEMGDKKARFALVIMSALNAITVLIVVRGGEGAVPKKGAFATVIAIELGVYAILMVYYVLQAILALRPRGVTPPPLSELPSAVTPGTSMRMLFWADVVARDRAQYGALWREMRMDNLNAELSDQLYALSTISREKYDALERLYVGLMGMTAMLVIVIATMALHRAVG